MNHCLNQKRFTIQVEAFCNLNYLNKLNEAFCLATSSNCCLKSRLLHASNKKFEIV